MITSSVSHLKHADYIYFIENNTVQLQGKYESIKNTDYYINTKQIEEEVQNKKATQFAMQLGLDQIASPKKRLNKNLSNILSNKDINLTDIHSDFSSENCDELHINKDDFMIQGHKRGKNKLFRSLLGGSKKNDMLYPDWIHDTANIHEDKDNGCGLAILDYNDQEYEANKFINEYFYEEEKARDVPFKVFIRFFRNSFKSIIAVILIFAITQYAS